MPRDDDDFEDDDRPRRRRPRHDDEDDRPARSRRREDDEDDQPPRRKRRVDDDEDYSPPQKKGGKVLLILGIVGGVLLLCCGGGGFGFYYLTEDTREARKSSNNLREIGLAYHNHEAMNGFLPDNTYAPDGKPLLSWRVHILPYVGENALYQQFNLKEPWDSPTNRPLIARMPRVFATPDQKSKAGEGKTYYRGFSHDGAIFEKSKQPGVAGKLSIMNITDGTSNTIFVLEAGEAVEWTKPEELDFGPGKSLPSLGAGRSNGVAVLMGDGSIRIASKKQPESNWRAAISYNGGEVVYLE